MRPSRRTFLIGAAGLAASRVSAAEKKPDDEVPPVEDLMREHGVLRRVLLVYGEGIRRLDGGEALDPGPFVKAAGIVRRFVEDYHERDEEQLLFPRFEKAGKLVELVKTLRAQHQAGRRVTDGIVPLFAAGPLKEPAARKKLADLMRQFVRMYEPHAAREDTVLFPEFRSIVGARDYEAIGDQLEAREHQLFGEDGFEKIVDDVAAIEKQLGLYDLAQFTPAGK
jgi:hemerythrin-like domain-containing protein